ncbi:putative RING-type E3 ubiquitin transferase [Microsporum canis]|uniref:E3 ubiquitin-protein ligase CHIP n=1 Tax=Arthroderma otae (strain ATCC MYA-4605 / CBS 113480) TaxID=554155 RepID=C5FIN1_ARTOC|nr:U-box domain-containing protein [Microsporum canis CBS 113480]EEQ29300.1 U-box domain-containing protein [Microsporum canis CBS 113480]
MAYELKARGNERYKEGDYEGAEELYSQAIQKNSNDPAFFNNRALVRIKLGLWEGAEHDSRIAVDLYGPKNQAAVKSNYYLSQALLGLQRPAEALEIALAAYKSSLETKNPNSEPLSRIILRAKQSIWAAKETARLRERNETLKQVETLMEAELKAEIATLHEAFQKGEMGKVGFEEDKKLLEEEYAKKLNNVREAFASVDPELQERHMPEHLIDNITFEVMHDPVVTPSGHSFERTSILKHMQQSEVDPITRVPMTASDLRPNYALKAACEDFLEKNGWAVDW